MAIMGTKYVENFTPPPTLIEIDQGAMKTYEAPVPTVDPLYAIGNDVEFVLRQKGSSSDSNWVKWVEFFTDKDNVVEISLEP